MYTCLEKLDLASFAILDGHDRHVVLAPDLPTWDENQPPQYRKSPRLSHRLLRIPDTDPFPSELQMGSGLPQINVDLDDPVPSISLPENTTLPISSATWKLHWPIVSRGTCACVGIKVHPNTPDSPVDALLYWDLASVTLNRFSGINPMYDLPTADFTMTLTVLWKDNCLLEASLIYHFVDLPPNAARTLRREIWLGHSTAPSITLTPFISTAWGCAQVDMQFIGFLKPGVLELKTLCRFRILQHLTTLVQSNSESILKEYDILSEVDRIVKRMAVPKLLKNQLRLLEYVIAELLF